MAQPTMSRPFTVQQQRIFFFVCLALCCVVLAPLWRPIGVGLILGYFSEDWVERIASRLKLGARGRMATAALLIAAVLLVVLLPVGFALYQAVHELVQSLNADLFTAAQGQAGTFSEMAGSINRWLGERLAAWGLPLPSGTVTALGQRLREASIPLLQSLLGALRGMAAATPRAVLYTLVAVVAWWLAALDGPRLREQALPWLLPWQTPRRVLGQAARAVLRGLIVANLAVAAVQAVLCTLGLLLTGIPRAVSLGVMCFFLAFVPVVGTGLVTVGAALYLLSNGRVGAGLSMLALAIVAGTIDNLLRPFFLRGQVELPIAWIFLSIMGGLVGFGLAGVILGPIVAYACREAFLILTEPQPATGDLAPPAPAGASDEPPADSR
jgi:predicted PurR-regulated permease PerM